MARQVSSARAARIAGISAALTSPESALRCFGLSIVRIVTASRRSTWSLSSLIARPSAAGEARRALLVEGLQPFLQILGAEQHALALDRKSTRLNSSH